jgi:hypothetical protein
MLLIPTKINSDNEPTSVTNGYYDAVKFIKKDECQTVKQPRTEVQNSSQVCRPIGGQNYKGLGHSTTVNRMPSNITDGILFKNEEQAKNYARCSGLRMSAWSPVYLGYWVNQQCSPYPCILATFLVK